MASHDWARSDRPVLHRIASDHHFREVVDGLGHPAISDRYDEDWLSEQALVRTGAAIPHAQEADASSIGRVRSVSDGIWVYFPWRHHLIHLPERREFLELLYARNYPCISRTDQLALAELHVGVVGLSVGSSIARALVMTGVQRLRIADFDFIAPSNNNRMGAGSVLNVGARKATVLARDLYEFNPYLDLQALNGRLHDANMQDFLTGLDVVIDHMDGLSMKLRLRQEARRLGVPVIMATDVGVSPIFDIELPQDDAFFGGRVDAPALEPLSQVGGDRRDWVKAAAQVIGVENMPEPVLANFLAAYRGQQSYVSQLGITGYLAAAQVAFLVLELGAGSRLATDQVPTIEPGTGRPRG
jgi:molybdopterin/thiamine biosynthesis adenylyltransferase